MDTGQRERERGEGRGRNTAEGWLEGSRDARTTKVGDFVGRFSLRAPRVDR